MAQTKAQGVKIRFCLVNISDELIFMIDMVNC